MKNIILYLSAGDALVHNTMIQLIIYHRLRVELIFYVDQLKQWCTQWSEGGGEGV